MKYHAPLHIKSLSIFLSKRTIKYLFLSIVFCSLVNISFSQQGFGTNSWNVNVYDIRGASGDINTLPINYKGYYTQKLDISGNYGVNTKYSWTSGTGSSHSPSNAAAFNNSTGEGTKYTNVNGTTSGMVFTFIHKRKGFPSGKYKIVVDFWDDETYIFIDGVLKTFVGSAFGSWGTSAVTLLDCVTLDENTTIEIRTSSEENPSNLGMTITPTNLTIDAGESKQICDGDNVVLDGSPNTNNATYSWSGGAFVSGASTLTPTVSPSANTTYTLTATLGECVATSSVMVNVDIPVGQSEFGNQVWNVYGYNGNDITMNNAYRGYYEQPELTTSNLGVNTELFWSSAQSPSTAGIIVDNEDLWNGCPVSTDNHIFIHKRKGFPCGNYTFNMNKWDDEVRVLIDGLTEWSCVTYSGTGNCTNRTFTVQLDVDSEVEIQVFENTGASNLSIEVLPVEASSLTPTGVFTRKCRVNGVEWVRFFDENDKLIASINPNGSDLGNVTMTSYVGAPMVMEACNTPHPMYHTAYMGRRWVMNSDLYPNGLSFNNDVTVRLPYDKSDLANLNTHAQSITSENLFDGGDVEPALKENLMLTKITGGTEDGIANSLDCGGTTLGIINSGRGLEMESILNTEYVDFEVQQFSEFFLHKNNDGSALPVKLTNFSASCENNVSIHWTTASEQNSDYFVVEKSRDGQNWVFVAEQNAAGNSSEVINYTQLDENISGELTYYRLRQIDFDGKEEVFGPISVSCDHIENGMKIFPNPNDGSFTIEILSSANYSEVDLLLNDVTGKLILSKQVNISEGTTQILMNNLDLRKGAYFVSLQGAEGVSRPIKVILN